MGKWHGRDVNRAAWNELRQRVLVDAGYRCQINLPGICIGTANSVDHIRPVSEGGAVLDQNNCRAACTPCNNHLGVRLGGQRFKAKWNNASRVW